MLLVAKLLKPHGIKGEIKVEYYLDDFNSFLQLQTVNIDGTDYTVEKIKNSSSKPYAIIKLKGIVDMNAAESLRNKKVFCSRENMPEPHKGHHYIDDLIGCKVVCDGEELGILKDVLQNGCADVYVIVGKNTEIMFPYVGDVINKIDIDHKLIIVDKTEFDRVAVYGD